MAEKKALSAIELFSESIKSTFDLRFFVVPLLQLVFWIIACVGGLIVVVSFGIFGSILWLVGDIIALFFPEVVAPFGASFGLMSLTSIPFLGLVFVAIAATILAILLLIASGIIGGFYVKSVDQYLKTKHFSVEENIRFALSKWKKLATVVLLQVLVGAAVAAITLLPATALSINYFIGSSTIIEEALTVGSQQAIPAAVMPVIAFMGVGITAFAVINFLISPLFFLWLAAAVFEEKTAFECISKGYAIGKAKYLRNLVALLLMSVVGIAISGFSFFDPTFVISFALFLWLGLAYTVLIVKAYREGQRF